MPQKIQPIGIQESRCIFDGITSNVPTMHRTYVEYIVLATVFSMAWYGIFHGISLETVA